MISLKIVRSFVTSKTIKCQHVITNPVADGRINVKFFIIFSSEIQW